MKNIKEKCQKASNKASKDFEKVTKELERASKKFKQQNEEATKEFNSKYKSLTSNVLSSVETNLAVVNAKETHLSELHARLENHFETLPKIIKLNVGGKRFETAKENLLRHPGSYFFCMLSTDRYKTMEDGSYFIDRNPAVFDRILDYLRGEKLELRELTPLQIDRLKSDFESYAINLPEELCDPPQPSLIWDPTKKSDNATYSENGLKVTKTSGDKKWNCGVIGNVKVDKYSVKIEKRENGCINIGFTTGEVWEPNGENYRENGWFLATKGKLFGIGGIISKVYTDQLQENDIVTVIRDGTAIRFAINGIDKGIAFENVPNEPLYPALDLYDLNNSLSIVPNP